MDDREPGPNSARIELAEEPEFELGGVIVRPGECTVAANEVRREVQPRVMQVLIALARARPGVVSRDRLVERCWNGRIVGDDAINRCILALRHLAEQFEPRPFAIETVPRVGYRLKEGREGAGAAQADASRWRGKAAAAAAIALALGAAIYLRTQQRGAAAALPTIVVAAAAADGASQALARDLAVKLGNLQAIRPASMRLVSGKEGAPQSPDFAIQVERVADRDSLRANVALMRGGAILWSSEFGREVKTLSDLNQQLAFTVARVLGCALEGLDAEEPLAERTMRDYLSLCAALSNSRYDGEQLIPRARDIVRTAPRFTGGWAKLLIAETDAVSQPTFAGSAQVRRAMASHIAAARSLDPDLPEAFIAEYFLLPPKDFLGRSRVLDRAAARNPDNAATHAERAHFLLSVGRLSEAVFEAREAVRLDPLSPALRDTLVLALATAGRNDTAVAELREAERLWPGATSLRTARFRHDMRFGDPASALAQINSGVLDTRGRLDFRPFLQARIERSPEAIAYAIRQSREAYASDRRAVFGYAQVLAEFDRKDELLNLLLNWDHAGQVDDITEVVFRPAFAELHRDPRFMMIAKRLGLLDYWRASRSWPDLCLAPDLPYDCETEAARLTS